MDLNGDGNVDILSGSYSRDDEPMAGLFQVLWGKKDGTFRKAEVLNGSDGKPLLIFNGEVDEDDDEMFTDMICTRVHAADLDGDGKLDLVSGNASGSFYFFKGEGNGKFVPTATKMSAGGQPLRVDMKSDPFLVDWDKDGDLDLMSGSEFGGVHFAKNVGSKSKPIFEPFKALVKNPASVSRKGGRNSLVFGDQHIQGPGGSSRLCVDDVNGDGRLDILVGDYVTLTFPARGVAESDVKKRLAAWNKKYQEHQAKLQPQMDLLFKKMGKIAEPTATESREVTAKREAIEKEMDKLFEKEEPLMQERDKIVREVSTGYVWVYYQRSDEAK